MSNYDILDTSKKTLIFDFDGTILNSFENSINLLYNKISLKYFKSNNISKEDLSLLVKNHSIIEIFKKYKINKLTLIYLIWKIRKELKKDIKNEKIFDKMAELIISLEKKYNLGVLSSNLESNIKEVFERYKLLNKFVFIKKASLFKKDISLKKIIKKYHLN